MEFDKQCGTCRFWVWHTGVTSGNCHKRSPIAVSDKVHESTPGQTRNPYPDETVALWAHVKKDDFCGEWEKKHE